MGLTLHFDGGSRGNPGPAAAGVVVSDANGPLFEAGFHLPRMTNNQAEYHGLLRGLEVVQRLGGKDVSIFSDSELVVRQISGQYKVRNPGLADLYAEAKNILNAFARWKITHVRRESNSRADELANRAMDAGQDVIVRSPTDVRVVERDEPLMAEPDSSSQSNQSPAGDYVVRVECTAAPDKSVCPAPCRARAAFECTSTVPPGICLLAAPELLTAVRSALQSGTPGKVKCPHPGCGAAFRVTADADHPTLW